MHVVIINYLLFSYQYIADIVLNVNVGNISKEQLLIKLRGLVTDLGYECEDWARSPQQMNSEIVAALDGNKITINLSIKIL